VFSVSGVEPLDSDIMVFIVCCKLCWQSIQIAYAIICIQNPFNIDARMYTVKNGISIILFRLLGYSRVMLQIMLSFYSGTSA
jgi:hypothetical protein